MADYANSDAAAHNRARKARLLASFSWHRDISGTELLALPAHTRRKLARAAGTNPPSTDETWHTVAQLLQEKAAWAARHPEHSSARRDHRDEKILWVKPPITPWYS